MSLTDKVREHNVSFGRVYPEEDVKAFIKELTEVLMNTESTAFALCELERLAGPALVEEEKRYKTYTDPKLESEDGVEEEKHG